MKPAFEGRLRRFEELERQLGDPALAREPARLRELAKEHARLKLWAQRCRRLQRIESELRALESLLEGGGNAGEIRQMALAERSDLRSEAAALTRELEEALLTEDPDDEKGVVIEVRAGTGGAEAALFAADLVRMYTRYAARSGWTLEPLSMNTTEIGGYKEAIFALEGRGVYGRLKWERGVHRVQRVPQTEASGRIHTSTATVAVLRQAEETEIRVDPNDLRVDVFRSSGPGGQSVNTADSAVRVTHLPTHLVVICQDERSQMKNKAKAMKVLRARLLEMQRATQAAERSQERRTQIGTGERSEKIRTYNFPDRRVTDHRVNFTTRRLEAVLDGELDELLEALRQAQRQKQLKEAG